MTPNMLMVLIDVHRGTLDKIRHLGTYNDDLANLQKAGLIARQDGRWQTTAKGTAHVERACGRVGHTAHLVWEDACDPDGQPQLTAVYDHPATAEAFVTTEAGKWVQERPTLRLVEVYGGPTFRHFELHTATHHPQHRPTAHRRWTVQTLPLS